MQPCQRFAFPSNSIHINKIRWFIFFIGHYIFPAEIRPILQEVYALVLLFSLLNPKCSLQVHQKLGSTRTPVVVSSSFVPQICLIIRIQTWKYDKLLVLKWPHGNTSTVFKSRRSIPSNIGLNLPNPYRSVEALQIDSQKRVPARKM